LEEFFSTFLAVSSFYLLFLKEARSFRVCPHTAERACGRFRRGCQKSCGMEAIPLIFRKLWSNRFWSKK